MNHKTVQLIIGLLLVPCVAFCQDIQATVIQTSSSTANDGSISIGFNGGLPPYEIYWSGPTLSAFNNNQTIVSNLSAGSYSARFTDSQCGEAHMDFTINRGTDQCTYSLNLSANIVNPCSLSWLDNGSIQVNPTNGMAPYNYTWSNNISGLQANAIYNLNVWNGPYSVTVTDRNGCQGIASYDLSALTINSVDVQSICANGGDNRVTINVSGGTPPYTYHWGWGTGWTSQPFQDFLGEPLPAYRNVWVKDASGCETYTSFRIEPIPNPLSISISEQYYCHPSGYNGTQAQININQTGGSVPFTYRWSDGATESNRPNVNTGWYSVTVTDARGCESVSNSVSVIFPKFSLNTASIGCYDAQVAIDVLPHPYYCSYCPFKVDGQYKGNISPNYGSNSNSFSMTILPARNHPTTFEIKDNNGCITQLPIPRVFLQPSIPIIDWSFNNNQCLGVYHCVADPSVIYGIDVKSLVATLPLNGTNHPCDVVVVSCPIDGIHRIIGQINGEVTLYNGATFFRNVKQVRPNDECLYDLTCEFEGPSAGDKFWVSGEGIHNCPFAKDTTHNNPTALKQWKITYHTFDVNISPNPFSDKINILVKSPQNDKLKVELFSPLGRLIDSKDIDVQEGYSNATLTIDSSIPTGMYLITVSDSKGFRFTKKLIHSN